MTFLTPQPTQVARRTYITGGTHGTLTTKFRIMMYLPWSRLALLANSPRTGTYHGSARARVRVCPTDVTWEAFIANTTISCYKMSIATEESKHLVLLYIVCGLHKKSTPATNLKLRLSHKPANFALKWHNNCKSGCLWTTFISYETPWCPL